ncbi:MAG: hypothetical protein R3Y24_11985 [Eubacteriales bacterium]
MKNKLEKLSCLGILIILTMQLFGCGSTEEVVEDTPKFVYTATYETIGVDENTYISGSKLTKEAFYYNKLSFDEETGSQSSDFVKYTLADKSETSIPFSVGENENIQTFSVNGDNTLSLLISEYQIDGEDYENARETFRIVTIDESGEVLMEADITSLSEGGEYTYFAYMESDSEGNLYLYDGNNSVYVLDATGQLLFQVTTDNWIQSIGENCDDKVMVTCYGEEGIELRIIDVATKGFGEVYTGLPYPSGNSTVLIPTKEGNVILSSGNQLIEFELETGERTEILNWIDCDIDADMIEEVNQLEDGRFVAVIRDYSYSNSSMTIAFLEQTPYDATEAKTELTFSTLYLDQTTRKEIINFNQTNPTYRINVKEYGLDDYESAIVQLQWDLAAGNAGDIIDLSNIESLESYVEKGIVEDLYPFIEAEAEFSKEDFVDSALEAYTVDGTLCGVLPSFSIVGLMGKESLIGEGNTWTVDDVMEIMESKGDDVQFMSYATKDMMLSMLLYYDMDTYIDWSTGDCHFATEEFQKVLEFCNTFPTEFNYDEEIMNNEAEYLQSGKILTTSVNISDMQNYQMYQMMFGEDAVVKGYPNDGGIGVTLHPYSAVLGMNANSEYKDGVWEFLRIFFTDEYQMKEENSWGFPTKRSALEAQFAEDMTPEIEVHLDGTEIEVPKTTWGWNEFTAEIYAATEKDVEQVMALIDQASTTGNYNQELMMIIAEETEGFFTGQKSAEEVSDIIQSRVSIYVNENR